MILRALTLASLFLVAISKHACIYNKVEHPAPFYVASTDPSLDANKNERLLQEDYESIRIYADYSTLNDDVNATIKDYIQNEIMPSTLSYFEKTLKIRRLPANLTVNESCNGYDPPDFLKTQGVAADLVILVVVINDPDIQFVALSTPCGQSLIDDRPVFGLMTFNLAYMVIDTTSDDQENLSTALHEMVHVLGFSTISYPYFRNPDTGKVLDNIIRKKVVNNRNVTYIDVEPLTSRLREYFNCSTLEGAYLEDEGDPLSAGTHFERITFMNEFMTASSIPEPVISEFTLALLEGSGWYKPLYNMTEPFNWGRNKGCMFTDGPCTKPDGKPSFVPEFCDTSLQAGCTFTSRSIGFCGLNEFNDTFADNCPYYESDFSFDCENTANQVYAFFPEEIYGPVSRCYTGDIVKVENQTSQGAYCFPTHCHQAENGTWTLTLKIGDINITCGSQRPIPVLGFVGALNCPDAQTFCKTSNPVFCEKGCTGKGACVSGVCQCEEGWEGVDCAKRTQEKKDCDNGNCAEQETSADCEGENC